jgi:hypothetical protein
MPQILRLPVDFWAEDAPEPNLGRANATSRPQTGGEGTRRHEALARIGVVPLGAGSFFER